MSELFSTYVSQGEVAGRLAITTKKMGHVCDAPRTSETEMLKWKTLHSRFDYYNEPQSFVQTLESFSNEPWQHETIRWLLRPITDNPAGLVRYLRSIPSYSSRPYLAMKVFNEHMLHILKVTPLQFLSLIDLAPQTDKVFILWRRRMIESFVSYKIAMATNKWRHDGKKTTQVKSIVVDKAELEAFIKKKEVYYSSVRQALTTAGIDFEVFEYNRDLLHPSDQLATIERVIPTLGLSSNHVDANEAFESIDIVKQNDKPINELIQNWNDVVDWGYGGETEMWKDLFAS